MCSDMEGVAGTGAPLPLSWARASYGDFRTWRSTEGAEETQRREWEASQLEEDGNLRKGNWVILSLEMKGHCELDIKGG